MGLLKLAPQRSAGVSRLPEDKAKLVSAAEEVVDGKLDDHFPAYLANRSGTQSK
jgi:fumarate hydratase class II